MLTVTGIMAAAMFLGAATPAHARATEAQAQTVASSCHCACCKGGVCKCGMRHHNVGTQTSTVDSARVMALFSRVTQSCNCNKGQPFPKTRPDDIISQGYGAGSDIHCALSCAAFSRSVSDGNGFYLQISGVFDPSPPGSFRTIPLRI